MHLCLQTIVAVLVVSVLVCLPSGAQSLKAAAPGFDADAKSTTSHDAALVNLRSAIQKKNFSELSNDIAALVSSLNPGSPAGQLEQDDFAELIKAAELCNDSERRAQAANIITLAKRLRYEQLIQDKQAADNTRLVRVANGVEWIKSSSRLDDETYNRIKGLQSAIFRPAQPSFRVSTVTEAGSNLHPRTYLGKTALFKYSLRAVPATAAIGAPINNARLTLTISCPKQQLVFEPTVVDNRKRLISLYFCSEVFLDGKLVRRSESKIATEEMFDIKPKIIVVKSKYCDQDIADDYTLQISGATNNRTQGYVFMIH